MNIEEFKKFDENNQLSILARLIYVFYIKKKIVVNQTDTIEFNIKEAQQCLSVKKKDSTCAYPNAKQIKQAVFELKKSNMIIFFVENTQAYVALLGIKKKNIVSINIKIEKNWQPSATINNFLERINLTTTHNKYLEELDSFKSYWIKKATVKTQDAWTKTFIQFLKDKICSNNQEKSKYDDFNKKNLEQIKSDFARFSNSAASLIKK